MKPTLDPAGLSDVELAAAAREHQRQGDAYQRMAAADESPERAEATRKLAARHQSTADACRKEARRRKRAERRAYR